MSFQPVTDGDKRRYTIFQKYSSHLRFLKESGIVDVALKFELTYICPVCLRQFSTVDLDQKVANPLTLEDAPPKALGGTANILTCKECNNTSGQTIDVHLSKRLVEMDHQKFVPRTVFPAKTEKNGLAVQALVEVSPKGEITIRNDLKRNNPQKLDQYISQATRNTIINLKFENKNIDVFKLQVALLKTGYLLAFQKYGYSFLLQTQYDKLREQLINPNVQTYPTDFWFYAKELKPYYGIPFMIEPGLECIFTIFPLVTDLTEHSFGVIIPISSKPIEQVIKAVTDRFEKHHAFEAKMDGMDVSDFLFDLAPIKRMLDWIAKVS